VIFDPEGLEPRDRNGLLNGLVYPRPVAWVSTVGQDGSRNLAPFSFFNLFAYSPPTVGIGPGSRAGVHKDSLRNIKDTGEFVVNLVSEDLAQTANLTSAEFGPEVDEWDVAGLRPAPSEVVAPARVAEAPAALECRVLQVVDLGDPGRTPTNSLVIARVLRIHVADEALDGLRPRPEALRLVGRMGGDLWCRTSETFELPRPATADPAELRR
jgi:flavin reductase (DIM6/NTAB) family NADH-FMN oxidoreductase RutF